MDYTIVIGKGGKIIESGHHEDLLALGGYYAKSWRLHIGEERPGDLEEGSESDDDSLEGAPMLPLTPFPPLMVPSPL